MSEYNRTLFQQRVIARAGGDYMEPHEFWDNDDEDPDFKP